MFDPMITVLLQDQDRMPRGFNGPCFTCGGRGHKSHECLDDQVRRTNLVDRQTADHEEQGGTGMRTFTVPFGTEIGGPFSDILSPRPGQQRVPEGVNVERGFAIAYNPTTDDLLRLCEEFTRKTGIENPALVMFSDSYPTGAQPVRTQGQAGRGSLPGARDAQRDRAGAGLLGDQRVRRSRGPRRQEHRHRQGPQRDRQMHIDDEWESENFMNGPGAGYNQGRENTGTAGGQGRVSQEQGGADNQSTQASRVDSEERPQDPQLHRTGPRYEMGPGWARGWNLDRREGLRLTEKFFDSLPPGSLVNMKFTIVPAEDRAASN